MNKKFLDWLIKYTHNYDYEYKYNNIMYIKYKKITIQCIKKSLPTDINWEINYANILQEAIEGVNRSDLKISIYQNDYCLWLRYNDYGYYEEKSFYFKKNPDKYIKDIIIYKSEIEAKKTILKYVYDLSKEKII